MGGQDFDLTNDDNILAINSPRGNVKGPYKVVYKDEIERWAIVALDWNGEARLGMRWFWGNGGSPMSSGYPIWYIIPPTLSKIILSGLPIYHKLNSEIDDFLSGKISGADLE